tara:strand:- start:858 stop:1103 length:246 start_codon:yes stop_codon:yes gene_type:complete
MKQELSNEVKQLMKAVGLINDCLIAMLEINEGASRNTIGGRNHALGGIERVRGGKDSPLVELENLLRNWPDLDEDTMGRQF